MTANRLFTDQELKEMSTRTLDLVFEAIDAGDKEKAKKLAERMYREFNHLHDGYGFWVSGLQTYIYKNYGIDALEEAEREAHTVEAKIVFKPIETTDLRTRVSLLARGLRGHLQPLKIEENDEMICITMQPCGSGERIIQKGGYEAGLARVKEPHRITWGKKDFPIYCVHCPVMEALDIENTGDFIMTHIVEDPIYHGSCKFAFYKDPKNIPEEFYTRIGKKKP
jgi:hypothetical protein